MGKRPEYTLETATQGVQDVIDIVDGRWKLTILFQLFGGKVMRFSALERAMPGISQKMLAQQLRQLERDGVVTRIVHNEVPRRVEYHLTAWGQELCPALDALLIWHEAARPMSPETEAAENAPACVPARQPKMEPERQTGGAVPRQP